MNNVTLDWLDMIVIFSVFAACAVVGWLAACLMSRVEAVKPREPREPMAPVEDAQRIEVTVVDRGWSRWRRRAGVEANRFQGSPRKILSLR
jgi:hypothetical protein